MGKRRGARWLAALGCALFVSGMILAPALHHVELGQAAAPDSACTDHGHDGPADRSSSTHDAQTCGVCKLASASFTVPVPSAVVRFSEAPSPGFVAGKAAPDVVVDCCIPSPRGPPVLG